MTDIDASFTHNGIALVQTCGACPEKYDAYDGSGRVVGYFRLRHGFFSVNKWGPGGEEVFAACPKGDGIFAPEEREMFLKAGINALKLALKDGAE